MEATSQVNRYASLAKTVRLILTRRLDDMCSLGANEAPRRTKQGLREIRTAARHLSYTLEYFKPFLDYAELAAVHQDVEEIISGLGAVLDEETFVKSLTKLQPEVPTHILTGVELLIKERR